MGEEEEGGEGGEGEEEGALGEGPVDDPLPPELVTQSTMLEAGDKGDMTAKNGRARVSSPRTRVNDEQETMCIKLFLHGCKISGLDWRGFGRHMHTQELLSGLYFL
jgi:hypothetical protein